MKRTATAIWNGSGKEGSGNLTTQSTTLNKTQYSFKSRFEEGVGTNPEELIAAAHAGCFAMALSFELQKYDLVADSLDVTATVTIIPGTGITNSDLVLKAKIPGIDPQKFQEYAATAKANCPVSKVLNAAISLDASLV
jgi:lipoyl-dependent peroxiredoxin